jgi:hypothetical protein
LRTSTGAQRRFKKHRSVGFDNCAFAAQQRVLQHNPPESGRSFERGERQLRARSGREQMQQHCVLFDHLIGAGEQHRRHFNAERLGSLEVDHELQPGCAQIISFDPGFC